jgi:glutaredoxin 2
MPTETHDVLEQAKRLLAKRENAQVDFEASIRDSKRALARSQKMLDELQRTIAEAMNPHKTGA